MNQKEKIIIDLRQSTPHDLLVLSKLLVNISTILSCHGLTIQVKNPACKTTFNTPHQVAKS